MRIAFRRVLGEEKIKINTETRNKSSDALAESFRKSLDNNEIIEEDWD